MSPLHAPLVTRSAHRRLLAAVALVLALFATSLAAAPSSSAATMHRRAKEARIARAVVHLMNAERAVHGLSPLHYNKKLRRAARWHNLTMAQFNTMSHQLPGEAYFAKRIWRAGYHWSWAGENIGWNSRMTKAGVLQLQKFMYHEQAPYNGHRLNILSPHYRSVGIDVYLDRAHHKVWLTTDFGRRG